MEKKLESSKLLDKLSYNTSKQEFESLVGGVLTAQDKVMFGENAASCVAQAIIYPAAFAPFPATFDTAAFGSVVDDIMAEQMKLPEKQRFPDTDRVARLLEIAIEGEIIEMLENGRLLVPTRAYVKIRPILEKYDETQE